jgi:hypothetical protein
MNTNNSQFFQVLNQFEMWKDGDALTEQRLVQHELVLALLTRLYSNINWSEQNFCLYQPCQLEFENDIPKNIFELIAITKTGKLMVCGEYNLSKIGKPSNNDGLFAFADKEIYPDFPLYKVELRWGGWEQVEEIVKIGDGIPLGRLQNGQWDEQYIPPTVNVATNKNLQTRIDKLTQDVVTLKNTNVHIQALALEIKSKKYANLTPRDFWLAHCRCLIMLQDKISDKMFRKEISELESGFVPWDFGSSLDKLENYWNDIKEILNKINPPKQKSMRL